MACRPAGLAAYDSQNRRRHTWEEYLKRLMAADEIENPTTRRPATSTREEKGVQPEVGLADEPR